MRWFCLVAIAACCPPMSDKATTPVVVTPQPPPAITPAAVPTPASPAPVGPPTARTVDLVEKQFGIEASDPYRWMEGTDNAEYAEWLRAQGEYTAKQLAAIPGR